jgi:hypothetical protein
VLFQRDNLGDVEAAGEVVNGDKDAGDGALADAGLDDLEEGAQERVAVVTSL